MNHPHLSAIKRCSKCRRFSSVEGFCADRKAIDGLCSQCRKCQNASVKRWREKNPDKWRESRRRWKLANPEKVRAIHRNTSHKRYGIKRGGLTASELLAWEAEQPKVCHWCDGECAEWHVDHRTALSRGGAHEMHNLVISCPPCNHSKGARDPAEFAAAIATRRNQ